MANRALQFMIHSQFIKTCMFLKINVNRIRNVKVSFYLMCSRFHFFTIQTAQEPCINLMFDIFISYSLYVLPVNKKWRWWQKLLFCMGNWSLHDADQSLVSCKLVISSKCIQCILGTISKLHIWICSFELTYLMEDRVSHKVQKSSHVIYLDSHLVTFCMPNSTQQVPLSYILTRTPKYSCYC